MKKFFVYAMCACVMGFVSCNKDDDKEMTQQEMVDELVANGNDLIWDELYGNVKTVTFTYYDNSTWVNNAIKPGYINNQSVTKYNQTGFLTGSTYKSAVITSIKWTKDKQNSDVLVLLKELKTTGEGTIVTRDSKNRVIERTRKETAYTTKVGNYEAYPYGPDTIYYSNISSYYNVTVGNPLTSETKIDLYKHVTTYDDVAGTATEITTRSENGAAYVAYSKEVYKLDKYGRIDSGYEYYEPVKAKAATSDGFEDNPRRKRAYKYDSQGNMTERYEFWVDDYQNTYIYYYSTCSYEYY